MIELILAEDIIGIAKTGDTVVLKDDNTFEIQKDKYPKDYIPDEDEPVTRTERDKDGKPLESKKSYDPRIEKYLPNDKMKAWAILEKFNKSNPHFDANEVLKEFINKVATCPDVTDKFEKVMEGWMRDGEADISAIEKIIASCKKEGGNVVVEGDDKVAKAEHTCSICQKAERSPEQLKEMEAARRRQQAADEDTKIKPIGKSAEIIEAVMKESDNVRNSSLQTSYKESKEQEAARLKRKPTEKETDKHYFAQKSH